MKQQEEYGLIGKSLRHSFSPRYFKNKFDTEGLDHCSYHAFELSSIESVTALLAKKNLVGLNVTIPYKEAILSYCKEQSTDVKSIGASNCIKQVDSNTWKCFNTDVPAFKQSLASDLKPKHKNALILGTGGASKAVQFALTQMGITYQLVSRVKQEQVITYDEINSEHLRLYPVIINTTPLGTFPNVKELPNLPYQHLNSENYLFDLTYNPELTSFLMKGKAQDSVIKNGLEMLHLQAEISWKIWNSPEMDLI